MTPICVGQGIFSVLPAALARQLRVFLGRGSHPAIDRHVGHLLAHNSEIEVIEDKVEFFCRKDFVGTVQVLRHKRKAFVWRIYLQC